MFVYKPYNISMKSKSDFTRRNAQRLGLCSELKKKRQQPESRLLAWFLAQRVGFEPTVPLPVHLISSQGRYNHFDTAAYSFCVIRCAIIPNMPRKIKSEIR